MNQASFQFDGNPVVAPMVGTALPAPVDRSNVMTIRLTKKRLVALQQAITFDDLLHEKFRQMHEDLDRQAQRLGRMKRVMKVVQRHGNIDIALQILEVHPTSEGLIVICR